MSVEIQMNKIKRKLLLDKIHGQLQSLSLILFWKGSTALAYRLIKIFSFRDVTCTNKNYFTLESNQT